MDAPASSATQAVVPLFDKECIARPHIPHVFVVSRLMTHLWMKQLSKDADIVCTLQPSSLRWPVEMFESGIALIVLHVCYIPNYRGPCVAKGTPAANNIESKLTKGSKAWRRLQHDPEQFHELEKELQGIWQDEETWSRHILQQFYDQRSFPPCNNVWCRTCYQVGTANKFPIQGNLEEGRIRQTGGGPRRGAPVPKRQRWGSFNRSLF